MSGDTPSQVSAPSLFLAQPRSFGTQKRGVLLAQPSSTALQQLSQVDRQQEVVGSAGSQLSRGPAVQDAVSLHREDALGKQCHPQSSATDRYLFAFGCSPPLGSTHLPPSLCP
ncbi:hypothetical protein SKAU_G00162340 [Synaphobranchus kaupii]|uniref:Uncharacterized protein n=1 Tax=Synaphobranchus kaupii TaxID=118154 RepID=A0A9Q1FJ70_SYNKA|nr:hypothetical protein SKAU_G00162340 [Synaphobranchus kaupii]